MHYCSGLLRRYSPEFLENQQLTLCDVVQRAVKKGRGGEVGLVFYLWFSNWSQI